MKITSLFCTLATVLSGVLVASGQDKLPAYADPDAYEIYSALLIPASSSQKLVIQIETEDFQVQGDPNKCLAPAKGEEAIYAPVIENYRKMNKDRWRLQPKFAASISYQFVSGADLETLFTTGGSWKAFYKKYDSSAYSAMSAVGFNPDKTIAIVYKGDWCGLLCGFGTYHVFHKTEGAWSEIKWTGEICSWVS